MKFEIEAEVLVKGFSMIMENQNRNHEVALKVLDKTLDIADKFLDIAAASIKASDERSRIRFAHEEEDRKLRLARANAEDAELKAQYAEAAEERKLAAAKRQKEWDELNKKSSK